MKQPTYMLDTDMFSYLVSGRHPRVRELVAEREKSIVISSVTLAESLFGARKRGSEKLMSLVGLFSEIFPIVDWTSTAAKAYAEIRLSPSFTPDCPPPTRTLPNVSVPPFTVSPTTAFAT